ncbi:MAG: BatA domain-containing protein [Planctomycetota bacterium]|jgi:hypothetical protein
MSFTTPILAFGALLFAVPLIIHLLNRHRYKRRPWAAMEFLLRAFKKQRRRLRRENLLLLLLRCLIPILLALAIARPRFEEIAGSGLTAGAAHHILIIDHSYSMGAEFEGARTPFERARFLAGQLVDRATGKDGQKFTLLLAGMRPKELIREELNLERVKAEVASLPPPVDSAADLNATLARAAEIVEEAEDGDLRIYMFSDLQVRSFGENLLSDDPQSQLDPENRLPAEGEAAEGTAPEGEDPPEDLFEDNARDLIQRISERAPILLIDVRAKGADGGREDNLQITDLSLEAPHAISRVPVPVVARLLNRSSSSEVVQVTLEIDGDQPRRESTTLEAGAEGEVQFLLNFTETGNRQLRASLAADTLAADNERFRVVPVRDRLRVLIVEGSEETDDSLKDSSLIRDVLDPTGGEGTADLTVFTPKIVPAFQFLAGREKLEEFDLIVLANLESLNSTAAEALAAAVDQGTGLFVMLGPSSDAENYNRFLHERDDPLMPMRLSGQRGYEPGGDQYYGSEVRHPDHPIFADFSEEVFLEMFESLPIYRFIGSDSNSLESSEAAARSQVLVSVRDPELSPLMVSKLKGTGKAMFLTSAMSRHPERWNRLEFQLGAQASYLFMLVHPMAYWLTLPTTDPFNVPVGASLTCVLNNKPEGLAVTLPERAGQNRVPIGEEATPLLGDRYSLPPFRQTEYSGFYQMDMLLQISGGGQEHQEVFAVNTDPEEGDLNYFSHEMAEANLGVDRILSELPSEGRALTAGSSELGPLLLWLTLIILLSEAAMARWVSRRRS